MKLTRLKRYAERLFIMCAIGYLSVATYIVVMDLPSVDTNRPTCTSDTYTPFAGAILQLSVNSAALPNVEDEVTYTVATAYDATELTTTEYGTDEQSTETDNSTEDILITEQPDPLPQPEAEKAVEEVSAPATVPEEPEEVISFAEMYPQSTYASKSTLNRQNGRFNGPSGEETFYNLNMKRCVRRMQDLGYDYEYWVRDDGVKMFGPYVMIATDFNTRPLGTVLETSLGTGISCDTGEFALYNPTGIDIATNW